jgi:hypothetical protein
MKMNNNKTNLQELDRLTKGLDELREINRNKDFQLRFSENLRPYKPIPENTRLNTRIEDIESKWLANLNDRNINSFSNDVNEFSTVSNNSLLNKYFSLNIEKKEEMSNLVDKVNPCFNLIKNKFNKNNESSDIQYVTYKDGFLTINLNDTFELFKNSASWIKENQQLLEEATGTLTLGV